MTDGSIGGRGGFSIAAVSNPGDDNLKIRPLMTMVGGKMIVLQESLAREFGTQAVGPPYDFRDEDVAHIGKPRRMAGDN